MSRELRMVPSNWNHPIDNIGNHIPLFLGKDYESNLESWHRCRAGYLRDTDRVDGIEEFCGDKPEYIDYMPLFDESDSTHYMMYETTSEGTPISPAFGTKEELARWLADNSVSAFAGRTATYEQWLASINRGGSVSGVITSDGIISGVEFGA